MNAPSPQSGTPHSLQHVALPNLSPSRTHIQELRRARFTKEGLAELAASIGKVGILQAIVARPLNGSADKFEIVAGERRYLAAKQAGLASAPVNVRVLSDEEVLEIQLIENLQREGLHELEEAEGYGELMKLKKINADAVAEMVGKSRSYVYARTKLLALCPEARKAFYAGELDGSTALLIARIPPRDFQLQAMKDLQEARADGEIGSFRDAQQFIRERFMVRLKTAVFDIRSAELLPAAGACQACPKNSGNQPDFAGVGKGADVCTDPKCFDEKRQAHFAGARKAQEAKGKKVIYGEAAKRALPRWEDGDDYVGHASPYRKLNDSVYVGHGSRRVADIVGKDYSTILVQHPLTGKLIEVATQEAIDKAAGASKKGGSSGTGSSHTSWKPKAKAGPDVDDMLTDRLAELIHKKAPKAFGKPWLLALARELRDHLNLRDEDAIAKAWAWPASAFRNGYRRALPAQASQLNDRDLVLLMFDLVFAVGPYTRAPVLKLFGIKEPEIREQIIQERKAAAKKAREEAKAKKATNTVAKAKSPKKPAAKKKGKRK
jgi:ParB/RepB/Spo0J family partition protein